MKYVICVQREVIRTLREQNILFKEFFWNGSVFCQKVIDAKMYDNKMMADYDMCKYAIHEVCKDLKLKRTDWAPVDQILEVQRFIELKEHP